MAESTLPRSRQKLEYASCIDPILPSPAPLPPYPSSFDFLSQPRDCQRLIHLTEPIESIHHRALERDLRRLDFDSNQCIIDGSTTKKTKKKLDRTESISLPSTPVEQLSPASIPARYARALSKKISNDDDNPPSPTEFLLTPPKKQSSRSFNDDSRSSLRPTSSSSSNTSSSSSTSNGPSDEILSISYGVDWSDRARPTSHCWFSLKSVDQSSSSSTSASASIQVCVYPSCLETKSDLLQCECCSIIVHNQHLLDTSSRAIIEENLPCRPSFSECQEEKLDRHIWSYLPVLNKPCTLCRRKSMSSSLFGSSARPSTIPTFDLQFRSNTSSSSLTRYPVTGGSSPKMSTGTSHGYQCLWCSRTYHQRCWDQLVHQEEKMICDYGTLRHLIVRPQWLRRIPGPPVHFRAQYRFHYEDDSIVSSTQHFTPLLVFINKRSGGQTGEKIYRKLLHLLNPRQVFLLENDATILQALEIYSSLVNVRICVCGGDGTVGWVLSRLAELYPPLNNPPISICPLGTGNDLSRVLSWGEQYDPKHLLSILTQIPYAQSIALDRWQVTIEQLDRTLNKNRESTSSTRSFLSLFNHPKFVRDTKRASYQNNRTLPNTRFINYMSFGLDAAIALEFHDRRKRDPTKFSSPLKNKFMYLNESRKYLNEFARAKMWNLSSYIRLLCDGDDLTDSIRNCHTLVVLNIPGYASGTNPWGKSSSSSSSSASSFQTTLMPKEIDSFEQISSSSVEIDLSSNNYEIYEKISLNGDCNSSATITTVPIPNQVPRFERQDFGDKKIEVVGLSTTNMATIHMGCRGSRIAQCNEIRIEIRSPMTAQMDGEPFYLPESVAVNITHAGQVSVLRNDSR